MFCLQCGAENPNDSNFCRQCGIPTDHQVGERHASRPRRRSQSSRILSPPIAEDLGADDHVTNELESLLARAYKNSEIGNLPAAIMACEAILLIDPEHTPALSVLASLYERYGDLPKAVRACERLVALMPGSLTDVDRLEQLRRGASIRARLRTPRKGWNGTLQVAKRAISVPAVRGALAGLAGLIAFCAGASALHALYVARSLAGQDPVRTQSGFPPQLQQTSPAADTGNALPAAPTFQTIPNPGPSSPARSSANPFTIDSSSGPIAVGTDQDMPTAPAVNLGSNADRARGGDESPVPPLSIAATGNPDAPSVGDVQPLAPAAQTNGGQSPVVGIIQNSNIPQHIVIVGDAPDQASYGQADAGSGQSSQPQTGPPPPASYISIHIHHDSDQTRPDGSFGESDSDASGASGIISDPQSLQARALSLQEKNQFRAAAALYSAAIAKYKENLQNDEDIDESRLGLEACETGLQICTQSQ